MPSSKADKLKEIKASAVDISLLEDKIDRFRQEYDALNSKADYEDIVGPIDSIISAAANVLEDFDPETSEQLSAQITIPRYSQHIKLALGILQPALDKVHRRAELDWRKTDQCFPIDTSVVSELIARATDFVTVASDLPGQSTKIERPGL